MSSIALILESCLKRTNSFIRFFIVGVINTLTGLSTMFLLLNIAELSYWFSTFIGNSIGAIVSYSLNRTFTFQSKVTIKKSVPRFIAVILFCYLFSYKVSEMAAGMIIGKFPLIRLTGENLAIIIGTAVYMITNYFGQRLYVFRK
ncbi:GtrA family protein [Cytobacillus solani]|uniref:Polysaccharide biosynthesis protein GtrA n=1 Tax=Cytobacillus solani TaxID=1637975 RepID=A0A0Q3VIE1_9BACI|nr:GtrA family protein [Cytobacillus solani]KOP83007.1 polysaccharide biosynthesis protein GtrA [Bacillus sp. FJAT-21945]KQL20031.1 polysaccharide biosynthesis protein GtrA [Cytobacillus solani]